MLPGIFARNRVCVNVYITHIYTYTYAYVYIYIHIYHVMPVCAPIYMCVYADVCACVNALVFPRGMCVCGLCVHTYMRKLEKEGRCNFTRCVYVCLYVCIRACWFVCWWWCALSFCRDMHTAPRFVEFSHMHKYIMQYIQTYIHTSCSCNAFF
jgi:hypothetical protein